MIGFETKWRSHVKQINTRIQKADSFKKDEHQIGLHKSEKLLLRWWHIIQMMKAIFVKQTHYLIKKSKEVIVQK